MKGPAERPLHVASPARRRHILRSDSAKYVRCGDFVDALRQITAFAAARNLFAAVFVPGVMTPEGLAYMKKNALDYIDGGLEPICF